jgi:hypothetical protein
MPQDRIETAGTCDCRHYQNTVFRENATVMPLVCRYRPRFAARKNAGLRGQAGASLGSVRQK